MRFFDGVFFVARAKEMFLTGVPGKISIADFKKANLVLMGRATTKNDKNISTNIVAATFENDNGSEEVSGEKVLESFGDFGARKAHYFMEKINFPENTFYVSQSYLTIQKSQKDLLL